MRKFNNNSSDWTMTYTETRNYIVDEYFNYYGAKLMKNSVEVVSVDVYAKYHEDDRYLEKGHVIRFYVDMLGHGRKIRYTMIDAGHIVFRHALDDDY